MKLLSHVGLIGLISLIGLICTVAPVRATTATSSAALEILNKITAQVAGLATTRRVYFGQIKAIGPLSISLAGPDGDKTITTNEVTNYYRIRAMVRSETGRENIKAGDDLVAIGNIDPQTSELTARQIILKVRRHNIVGIIESVENNIAVIREFFGPTSAVDLADAVSLKKIVGSENRSARLLEFTAGKTIFVLAYYPSLKTATLSAIKATVLSP